MKLLTDLSSSPSLELAKAEPPCLTVSLSLFFLSNNDGTFSSSPAASPLLPLVLGTTTFGPSISRERKASLKFPFQGERRTLKSFNTPGIGVQVLKTFTRTHFHFCRRCIFSFFYHMPMLLFFRCWIFFVGHCWVDMKSFCLCALTVHTFLPSPIFFVASARFLSQPLLLSS